MRSLKVIGLVSAITLGLSACGDSLKTKEELSKLSYKEFAIDFCTTAMSANLEQLELMADEKYVKQMRSLSTDDEFDRITAGVECSDVTLTKKTKRSVDYTIAKFSGKTGLVIAITKKDGFYSAGT